MDDYHKPIIPTHYDRANEVRETKIEATIQRANERLAKTSTRCVRGRF